VTSASPAIEVPANLQPYVEYVTFSEGARPHDGVELMLTRAGVSYARIEHNRGSQELARWLLQYPRWRGSRTQQNVADEISTHALYANWPVLGRRANPVNVEYFQRWPGSLWLKLRHKLLPGRDDQA
jgi:hypothetical protein